MWGPPSGGPVATSIITCYMALIEPGKKAPAFALKDQKGDTHRLSDYEGRPVILYFYPKDDTPGCTQETCEFQAQLPTLKPSKAVVLGVSILDEKSKAKFAGKHGITFPLLADADHAVAEKYGVWQERSLYGRKYMGIARTTYLIGPDGKVAQRWDNVKVNGHVEAVTEALATRRALRRRGISLRKPLPCFIDITLEDEQAIGVAVRIREVVLLALADLDLQVLVRIVHGKAFEVAECGGEAIVLVVGVIAKALRSGDQLTRARPHTVLVDDGEREIEPHFPEANRQVARAGLDVNRTGDPLEALG